MIKPVLHRLIVKADPVETKTQSGIILTVNERKEQAAAESGVVVAVGETAFKDYGGDPSLVPVGTRIFFAKYAGKTVKDVDGQEYVCLNDEDIICVITPTESES